MDLFSGGTLRRMTIFALGIMPYITASIIFQLLTVVYEPLARIQKEGELGRRKITQWTRYVTVVLGALQSIGIAAILTKQGLVLNPGPGFILMTVLTLTTGTRLHHVAGRADHRSRHRQRHEPADFCRHRRRPAARHRRSVSEGPDRRLGPDDLSGGAGPGCRHGGGGGLHRFCGAQRAAHSHPERAAHCGPAHDGRSSPAICR